MRAFEANAVDYLVKPFSRERFAATLQRAKTRLSAAGAVGAQASAKILQALDALSQAFLAHGAEEVIENLHDVAGDPQIAVRIELKYAIDLGAAE